MMAVSKAHRAILAAALMFGPAHGVAASDRATAKPGGGETEYDYGFHIRLRGTPEEVMRFKHWLDRISSVPQGVDTLWAISRSGHYLTIEHSVFSVLSSGRTIAPMTMNLINGVGEDVTIKFNAYIPEQGSHRVFDDHDQPIEFTALQNLYHELAHAKHKTTGKWLYFRSEPAAIEEENVFRRELAALEHRPFHSRADVRGEAVCPLEQVHQVAWLGQELICKFN